MVSPASKGPGLVTRLAEIHGTAGPGEARSRHGGDEQADIPPFRGPLLPSSHPGETAPALQVSSRLNRETQDPTCPAHLLPSAAPPQGHP